MSMEEIVLIAVEKELALPSTVATSRASDDSKMLSKATEDLRRSLAAIEGYLTSNPTATSLSSPKELPEILAHKSSGTHTHDFARRFLESLPLPANIKVNKRVIWGNSAYAAFLRKPREELRGKTLPQILQMEPGNTSIEHTSEAGQGEPQIVHEAVMIDRKRVEYIAHRFQIIVGKTVYLCDVSFPQEQLNASQQRPIELKTYRDDGTMELDDQVAAAFLEGLCTSAAVKSPNAEIQWCNTPFMNVVNFLQEGPRRRPSDIIGLTSSQVFDLQEGHETPEYDRRAGKGDVAVMGTQRIHGRMRTVVHFPIFASEPGIAVEFIGIVSCEGADVVEVKKQNRRKPQEAENGAIWTLKD